MSQGRSVHELRPGDKVRSRDNGEVGMCVASSLIETTVQWSSGRVERREQFDPVVVVVELAPPLKPSPDPSVLRLLEARLRDLRERISDMEEQACEIENQLTEMRNVPQPTPVSRWVA